MNWLNRLLRSRAMEAQLDKELRFQLEAHAADLIALGADPAEARRQARLALGGLDQVKEGCRDARGTRWLTDLWQDLRYAIRVMLQKPAFAAVALSTLALGIGATAIMFTVVDGVLLKQLPYRDPGRLLSIHGYTATWNTAVYGQQNIAYPDFLDLQQGVNSLDLAGWFFNPGILSDPGQAEYVTEFDASSNLFSALGVPVFRGRSFTPEEDRAEGARVAILGYSLWRRRFAGNEGVLGTFVTLNGGRYIVVGIAAPSFRLRGDEGDIFAPIGQNTQRVLRLRRPHPIGVIARLRPGATVDRARSELITIGARLAQQFPDSNKDRSFIALPLRPNVGNVQSTLWLLLGAVALVLIIACANVASLMLARAVSRDRELGMRVALGATRGRLVRQCLTESAVLALAGGVLGTALAAVGLRPFVAFWPGALPRAEEIALDWRVLLFVVAASLASGVVFGLAPALRAPSRQLEHSLRAGSRTVAPGSRPLHSGFVAAEIALAMVLLVSAAVLGRSLLRLCSIDSGVDIHNVLTARMALSSSTLADPAKIRTAWQDILDRARSVPGVQSIAMVDTVPLREGNNQIAYWTSPAFPPENQQPLTLATSVTPDYLKVMGIRLLEGRFFDDRDRMGAESVAVVDEVMAKAAFPGQNAIGKRLWIGLGNDPVRVVGVVSHVRYWGPAGDDRARVRAELYYPFAQVPDGLLRRWSELMSIAVRTTADPLTLAEPLRRELRGAGNDQVLYELTTMQQLASASLARQRFLLLLFGVFAGLALLLACVGIYGVLAHLTGRRVPEIGVRMALGATANQVIWMVVRQSLAMTLLGIAVGAAGAIAAASLLQRLVEGTQPSDVSTYALTATVLTFAALSASLVPALRASRVDPTTALRQE